MILGADAGQVRELLQVGFDQIHPFLQCRFESCPGCVEHHLEAHLFRQPGNMAVEVLRNAGRQAAACHQEFRPGPQRSDGLETRPPLVLRQPWPGKNKAKFVAGCLFDNSEVFAGFPFDFDREAADAFLIDEPAEHLPGWPSDWVNRRNVGPEFADHARDIDPAAAWIAPRRRAAELAQRHHPIGARREIDRGVH